MSTFDIQRRLAAILGQPDRTTPAAGATVLVCLPAHCAVDTAALSTELAQRLTAAFGTSAVALCPNHLYTQPHFAPRDRLIINAVPGPGRRLRGCAGGPLGLLDFTDSAALIAAIAADGYDLWASVVAGTPDAVPLSELVQAFDDPAAAVSAFCAQPRIATMLAAVGLVDVTFDLDDYTTLLPSYQAGPAEHRRCLIDHLQLGDALLDLDGTLTAPAPLHQPRLTHSPAQRRHYHDEARRRLRSANPTTVLVACHVVTPQRSLV